VPERIVLTHQGEGYVDVRAYDGQHMQGAAAAIVNAGAVLQQLVARVRSLEGQLHGVHAAQAVIQAATLTPTALKAPCASLAGPPTAARPHVSVEMGDNLRVTVEVTRVGRPARLTGHPDRREPEDPPEWTVVALEVRNPYAEGWLDLAVPASGVTTTTDADNIIAAAIREELWR
jgi:hypothetical protein